MKVARTGDGFDVTPSGTATGPLATVIRLTLTPPAAAPAGTGTGLTAQSWANGSFTGPPAVTTVDPTVNKAYRFDGSPDPSIPADHFSTRWTGSIQPRFDETYTFTTVSDDTVRLWIDGKPVIDNTTPHGPKADKGTVTLRAGHRHSIRLDHTEQTGEAYLKLLWSSPSQPQQIVPQRQLYAD